MLHKFTLNLIFLLADLDSRFTIKEVIKSSYTKTSINKFYAYLNEAKYYLRKKKKRNLSPSFIDLSEGSRLYLHGALPIQRALRYTDLYRR